VTGFQSIPLRHVKSQVGGVSGRARFAASVERRPQDSATIAEACPMRRLCVALVIALACFVTTVGQSPAPAAKTFPPFDFARWARFIVREFFAVQPHEKIVLMADPSYYPELLDAIRAELLEAKA